MPEPLRLNNPEDLLTAIPYLIGYHPTDSIMCVAVRPDRTPMLINTLLSSIAPDTAGAAAAATAALVADEASSAIIVGYGEPEQVDHVVAHFQAALQAVDVDVHIVLRSADRRYFCLNAGCENCPADGTTYDPDTSLIAVHSVLAGRTALPNRAAVVAMLDPVDGARRTQMDAACRWASRRLRTMLRDSNSPGTGRTGSPTPIPAHVVAAGVNALRSALDAARLQLVLSDDEVAWLAVVLCIPAVEAAAWKLNTEDEWQRQLWTDVVRRATPALTATPACLLASTAYHAGNGVLASIAVERALQIEPDHGFAHLLQHALHHGVHPNVWRAALHTATAD